jgi:hypothetical protein
MCHVSTSRGHLPEDGLDQPALEGIELPIRHALPPVAQTDRQEVAGLDFVSDPAAGLAGKLCIFGDGEVVGRLQDIEQQHPFALDVRQDGLLGPWRADGRQSLYRDR